MRTNDAPDPSNGLRRQLGTRDGVALLVGIVLGSGIFVAPAAVAASAGSMGAALATWLGAGLVALCGALCYAECGARVPRAGGFFAFYREALGEGPAFIAGWSAVLVTYPASAAAIAHVNAEHVLALLGPNAAAHAPSVRACAAGAVVVAGAVNVLGVRRGARVQAVLTGSKVVALVLVLLGGLVVADPAAVAELQGAGTWPKAASGALLAAALVVLWTYDGWSDVALVAGELRDPARDLGRTVLIGLTVLVVTYSFVQVAVVSILGPERAAASTSVVADAARASWGPGVGSLTAGLVVLATFGALQGLVLTASRISWAMARQRMLPLAITRVSPAGNPVAAIALLTMTAVVHALVSSFRELLAFFSFAVWLFYGVTAACLLLLRHRRVGEPLAWRAPAGPLVPLTVLVAATVMTAALLRDDWRRCAIGVALMGLGLPAWLLWRRLRPDATGGDEAERDGAEEA